MYTDDQEQVQLIEKVYPSACADCCVDKADGEVCPQVHSKIDIQLFKSPRKNYLLFVLFEYRRRKIGCNFVSGATFYRHTGSESGFTGRIEQRQRDIGDRRGKRHLSQL